MSKKNKQTHNSKGFKIVILTLVFTMISGLFYVYNMSDRSKKAIIALREQKSNILKDLEKSQLFLDQILTSNKSLSKKLALEQAKVKKLIFNLKKKIIFVILFC